MVMPPMMFLSASCAASAIARPPIPRPARTETNVVAQVRQDHDRSASKAITVLIDLRTNRQDLVVELAVGLLHQRADVVVDQDVDQADEEPGHGHGQHHQHDVG